MSTRDFEPVEPRSVIFRGADDIGLAGDEWNPTAASSAGEPTAILLHGGGQTRLSWRKTGQFLARGGAHVVALDARGHGDSDRASDANYSAEAMVDDLLAVIDRIGRPVVLIGASLGGLTGIEAAHKAGPDVVTKLILVDVVPRLERSGSTRIRDFMSNHLEGFESLEMAAEAVSAFLPHREKPQDPAGLAKNLRLRRGRWYWHWDPAFLAHSAEGRVERTKRLEHSASSLCIPILLIRGKLSDVVSPDGVREFLAVVPAAEFVELSGAAHTAASDDNDAFLELVVEFINR
ncbi:alpha/beta fold hydrolase [Mycolicibacterium sp. P9-22]|uniref:alpha/beta fold hydrolase n=1 Tax=Mycolicibacterium sp. P9-22 TaxID=2024613 RepID=UPI001D1553DE|nr:alpha/beta hydrolase [Mycolicibacterium sp. P9-22]